MASTKKSRSIKSLKKSKDTEPMIHLTTHHTPVVSLEHINQGKFWGWAVFCFVVPFGIVAGILGGVNPPIVQKIDTLGQPTGEVDLNKVFGAAAVVGLVILVVYVLVVLSKPSRFNIYNK